MRDGILKIVIAGLVGGFIGNGVLGAIFSSPSIQAIPVRTTTGHGSLLSARC